MKQENNSNIFSKPISIMNIMLIDLNRCRGGLLLFDNTSILEYYILKPKTTTHPVKSGRLITGREWGNYAMRYFFTICSCRKSLYYTTLWVFIFLLDSKSEKILSSQYLSAVSSNVYVVKHMQETDSGKIPVEDIGRIKRAKNRYDNR